VLAIVGDGPYLEQLRRENRDVVFTGYLRGDPLWTAYASADVFVFPSATDTFGNVVLEANAAGLPAIVSGQGGPAELVRDGQTGFVVRAHDAEAFRKAMGRFLDDPGLRERMGREARAFVEDRNWTAAFEKFWNETKV